MKIRLPDRVRIFTAIDDGIPFDRVSTELSADDISLSMKLSDERLSISVRAESSPLFHIRLRWNFTESERRHECVKIMGDTWERTYGELEWRGVIPQRFMPWYMLVSNGSDTVRDFSDRHTECFGVEVRPSAVCSWQYDTHGVTLWLDVRCGGDGVLLGGRCLELCRVVMSDHYGVSAYEAGRAACRLMCRDGIVPEKMIYGSNNWYYAVGNSSHEQILRDARLITSLAEGIENRPYCVIDDGWQKHSCDGPWHVGNERFPDMARLAREIDEAGAVPGLWVRYLNDSHHETLGDEYRITSRPDVLDPSLPEVIEQVRRDTERFVQWGYRLIKHDFTVCDAFGVYGANCDIYLAKNGWSFHDRSRTTAEIVTDLYRAVYEAAGDETVIIGCNTISHLSAGLVHLSRTGNDTSGRYFERTRICGVNALAFRMMQNGIFYLCDADCASHTGVIDWKQNREWLRAVADSGTALFISADPDRMTDEIARDMKEALHRSACVPCEMIPVDWMENSAPEVYLVNGEEKRYNWYDCDGTRQFIPPCDPVY